MLLQSIKYPQLVIDDVTLDILILSIVRVDDYI